VLKIRINPWLIFLLVSTTFAQTPNCGCEQKPQLNVLAVVNGVKITQRDFSIDTRTQVSLAQETVITARAQELSRQINQMLFVAEAKKRGLPKETLLVLEVRARVPEPTEAEARAFYEQNKNRIRRSFGDVKKDILDQMRTERQNVRAFQYLNSLRAGAQIKVSDTQVTPPADEADLSRVFATVNGVNITSEDIEKELLPLIFIGLMGVSLLVYVVSDGYDLGVGMLMHRATPGERDTMVASIGPFWDANETWLVLGVGLLLVAFPKAHGLVLSELYLPTALMLVGLILRGAAFDFRVKGKASRKAMWDRLFIAGSMLASSGSTWPRGGR